MAGKKAKKKQITKRPTKAKTEKKKQAEVIRGIEALKGDRTIYND